jgi:methionyl-tRNA formyltransferase
MKILFMGTPEFARGALQAILDAGHEVVCVVTQPDRPSGRGRAVKYTPVKELAVERGIPVLQPVKIRTPESVARLLQYPADLFVVAAFGQILSSEILHMPSYGCINIHASLLPKYRGAAPIQQAILDGETQTGVTIMQMEEGLDTGAILTCAVVPILPGDTGDSLHDKLMEAGAKLVVETIPLLEQGSVTPRPQREEDACYAGMLKKAAGKIDWSRDAATLERLVRGLNSWPGAYTDFRNKTLKIWEAQIGEAAGDGTLQPGIVRAVTKETIEVQTGKGTLILKSVQPEGKKKMAVRDFLPGYPVKPGEYLGGQPSAGNVEIKQSN